MHGCRGGVAFGWRGGVAFGWGGQGSSGKQNADQAKRRLRRKTSGETGGETGDEAAAAYKTPITADKRGDKKERKKGDVLIYMMR